MRPSPPGGRPHQAVRWAPSTHAQAGGEIELDFMTRLGLVPNPVTVDQLVNESLLP